MIAISNHKVEGSTFALHYDYDCPKCGAHRGYYCTDKYGGKVIHPHHARLNSYYYQMTLDLQ